MSDLLDFSPPGQATFSLAGAKARFFDAGTTNPRTVYADEAETIPHPSPLLADSSGRFAQAFVSGGAVKVVVTQADDSTGYTLDPCVKVAATGSAANAVSFTPSVLRPYTNVQDAIDLGTFPARTITAGAGITVTNGDGVSGNPVISAINVPAGAIMHFAMNSAPTGWLKANGANVSRTTYAGLFAAIGTTFGAGDGSTTFTLPDLRGEFVRGWDDGRGVDSGRVFGSAQAQEIQSHTHDLRGGTGAPVNAEQGVAGALASATFNKLAGALATGGTETRPRNIALLSCIKF